MRFLCNNCDQALDCEHFWEGLSVMCPHCGIQTRLDYRTGQSIPTTGYDLSFTDFKRLLNEQAYARLIDPLIEKFVACTIKRSHTGANLIALDGSLIPLETAHLQIQMKRESQQSLYGAAMDLWR